MSAGWAKAAVEKKVGIRSWEVQTKDGRIYSRNRRHLRLSRELFRTVPPVEIFNDSPKPYFEVPQWHHIQSLRRHFKNDLARKLYNQDHEYLKSLVTKFQPLLLKSFAVHQQPLLLSPEVDEWKRDREDVTLNELTKWLDDGCKMFSLRRM